ncbi:MAG: DUF2851 family protein [Flavobacterium sp.]|nr:DUF2851 family protein [Flavobacterium sp.]
MKEDFLHYLWRFKKFPLTNLKTTAGEELVIVAIGDYLQRSGPDFFNAQILLNGQKWAGNVEIHIKSSDWYLHNHHLDPAYDNVILHIVWDHDTDVVRSNNSPIPVLELNTYVDAALVERYEQLCIRKSWLYCENQLPDVDLFIKANWLERLFYERLESKSLPIFELADETGRDWEAVLFYLLARNFGLNANGEAFFNAAHTVSYPIVRREAASATSIEALLFGTSGLLNTPIEDSYGQILQQEFSYFVKKYNLNDSIDFPVEFFKHRPDNFPTIRLSQLANLYHSHKNLFSEIIDVQSMSDLYKLFQIGTGEYWETHYQFDRLSPPKKKNLSRKFIDLLFVNTVLPLRFAYSKSRGEMDEVAINMIATVAAEQNVIVERFARCGLTARNAADSQALLQLKKQYCDKGLCLQCAIGIETLKSTAMLAKSS